MDDRSDYNCCSYKTLFDDGVCPNVSCALNKKIEGCYNCTLLDSCEIGFYKKQMMAHLVQKLVLCSFANMIKSVLLKL